MWTLQLDGLIGAISTYNVAAPTGAHYSGLTHLELFRSHPLIIGVQWFSLTAERFPFSAELLITVEEGGKS